MGEWRLATPFEYPVSVTARKQSDGSVTVAWPIDFLTQCSLIISNPVSCLSICFLLLLAFRQLGIVRKPHKNWGSWINKCMLNKKNIPSSSPIHTP